MVGRIWPWDLGLTHLHYCIATLLQEYMQMEVSECKSALYHFQLYLTQQPYQLVADNANVGDIIKTNDFSARCGQQALCRQVGFLHLAPAQLE